MRQPLLAAVLALATAACADSPPPPEAAAVAETPLADPDAALRAARVADSLKEAATLRAGGPLLADRLAAATADFPARGPADAPVTVVAFVDVQCPYCRRHAGTLDALRAAYPEAVRVVHAHFPLAMHDWARPAALASECAAMQDEAAFWTLHDLYVAEGDALTPGTVVARSRAALDGSGLDLGRWKACVADDRSDDHAVATAAVDAQVRLGQSLGVRGTPATFVDGTPVRGAQALDVFAAAVEAALAGGP